jgi:hypothetical protein
MTWCLGPSRQDLLLNLSAQLSMPAWIGLVWRFPGSPATRGGLLRLRHVHREMVREAPVAGWSNFMTGLSWSDPEAGKSILLDWDPPLTLKAWPLVQSKETVGTGVLVGQTLSPGASVHWRFSLSMIRH